MASLTMPLRNLMFMILLSVSCVTGIKGIRMVDSHVELATCCLADVTHTCRLGLEIRSSSPEWYSKGMRILAYLIGHAYWDKRDLTWAIMDNAKVLNEEEVAAAMRDACAKWAKVTPFTFRQVSHNDKPDIRIKFPRHCGYISTTITSEFDRQDKEGVTIEIDDVDTYTDRSTSDWVNVRFVLLYEMGHVLGLRDSDDENSVMYRSIRDRCHKGFHSPNDTDLGQDDIDAMKKKYGGPLPSGKTAQGSFNDSEIIKDKIGGIQARYGPPFARGNRGSFYDSGITRGKIGGIQARYGPPFASGMTTRTYGDQKPSASSSSDSTCSSDSTSSSESTSSSDSASSSSS